MLPKAFFRQVGFATKHFAPFLHSVIEREIFEGVQRVVVNENANRPLRRQQMGRELDDRGDGRRLTRPVAGVMPLRRGGSCWVHDEKTLSKLRLVCCRGPDWDSQLILDRSSAEYRVAGSGAAGVLL